MDPAPVGMRRRGRDVREGAARGRGHRAEGDGEASEREAGGRRRRRGGDRRRAERFVDPTPAPPPPPGAVETLVSMGFDEHAARRALGMCGNDLEAATNILLAGGD